VFEFFLLYERSGNEADRHLHRRLWGVGENCVKQPADVNWGGEVDIVLLTEVPCSFNREPDIAFLLGLSVVDLIVSCAC
jgi:hypothetical protein